MAQDSVAQVAVAFASVHDVPQVPQLVRVSSGVSQPFAAAPSQSPKPALHEAIAHDPVAQVEVALASEQPTPQAPQFASVVVEVSQPLETTPSQFAHPVSHATIWQEPVAQAEIAFGSTHGAPHAPQFPRVLSGVSQPLPSTPSQFPNPVLQDAIWQAPLAQVEVALARVHVVPHPPQLASVVSDVSHPFHATPSQFPKPGAHETI
jgi:hypothetical protein